ncbi:amino acid ABC transporter permease [Marisediminicola senii]|uniref:amino acid ABC transporter permease n=1 Tax=Marisediminicola senii TaxID=2711233 RepID=UPI0013EBD8F8|nr:amino acid ABC transporter permease [Marisediminicola senii]
MSQSVLYDAPGPKARRRSRIISIVAGVLVIAGLAWLIITLGAERVTAGGVTQPGLWDASRWDIFLDLAVWRAIGRGVLATLQMAAVAAVLAIVIGILFSFGRTAKARWIRIPTAVVLEFFRGMPVLLMMLFVLLVFSTGSYWAGVAGLAVYNGAIIGEILRAGIVALPKGQREAGLSIGLTPIATRFLIEFPQAFRQMLPIIIAQLVVLLKDTALAYIVGYTELLRQVVNRLSNFYGNEYFFSLFFVVLLIYLAINLTLSWIARFVARKTGSHAGAAAAKVPGVEGTQAITMQRPADTGLDQTPR